MRGTLKDCVEEIRKATGDLVTPEQAEELLSRIEDRAKERIASGKLESVEEMLTQDAMKMASDDRLRVLQEKKQAAITMVRKKQIRDFLDNYKNPGEGLWDYMVGGVKKRFGARNSVDYRGKAVLTDALAELYDGMMSHQDKTLELFLSGTIDREISRELFELGRSDGKPGITLNKQARQAAEVIFKVEDRLVDRMNLAGANIRKLQGYIVRQSHDATAIRTGNGKALNPEEAYKLWRDFILPKLDHEKTFFEADIRDPEKFLRSTWEALSSGIRKADPTEGDAPQLQGFVGPKNLGKKVSQSRQLHFKDADSWFDYNMVYGTKQLRESIEQGIEHAGRNIALMEGFGPSYKSVFDTVRRELQERHRNDPEILKSLNSNHLDFALAELDGSTRAPADIDLARMAAGVRSIQAMAKLGGATLSSISDIPTSVAMLMRNGHNPFKAYHNMFLSLMKGRGDSETQTMAKALVAAFDGILGESSTRYMSHDSIPGALSRVQKSFFKLNLMGWWNDSIRTGAARGLNAILADQAGLDFKSLNPKTRETLELYGMTPGRWELARKTAFKTESGVTLFDPGKVHELSDDLVKRVMVEENPNRKVTENNLTRFKDDVETQFRTYFLDQAEIGVPHPAAAERALALVRGSQPGTAEGEFKRFMMQFKGFPVAMTRKGVGMELFSRGAETTMQALKNGHGELLGLAHFIASTAGFGYLAMVAKDFFKGKNRRELLDDNYMPDPKTVLAAMAQGGGFGIYGDFLFGEYSRTGRSALATIAGPTFGQIDDVVDVYTRLRNGDDAAAATFKKVLNNTPFLNLFYTRTVLDYLILYNLQETMNPGALERMESRMQREQHQTFMLPPSSVIPRGGDLQDPLVGAREAVKQLQEPQ